MPLFEYTCQACGCQEEFLESAGSDGAHTCNACGSNDMRKGFSLFAARSKSSGGDGTGRSSSACASCSSSACSTCRR